MEGINFTINKPYFKTYWSLPLWNSKIRWWRFKKFIPAKKKKNGRKVINLSKNEFIILQRQKALKIATLSVFINYLVKQLYMILNRVNSYRKQIFAIHVVAVNWWSPITTQSAKIFSVLFELNIFAKTLNNYCNI